MRYIIGVVVASVWIGLLLRAIELIHWTERRHLRQKLHVKSGQEYWRMVEETARLVDSWPDWKKGGHP